MQTTAPSRFDGNTAAAALDELFGEDVTSALGTCDATLLRWATTPVSTWLHMPSLRSLELAMQQ